MSFGKTLRLTLYGLRILPQLLIYRTLPASSRFHADLTRWIEVIDQAAAVEPGTRLWKFIEYFSRMPEFRSLFYYRAPRARLFSLLSKPCPSLFIHTDDIGGGLFLQHGFSTIILAESIGANCWINQQVTIGYSRAGERPTLGDHVTVTAGAKVLGAIHVGDHVTVGANAVVIKDVAPHCTVGGVPARVIRRNGVKVVADKKVLLDHAIVLLLFLTQSAASFSF